MTKYNVTTPVAGFSGALGGVHFADGKAVIDDETHAAELAYARAQGYGVELAEGEKPKDDETDESEGEQDKTPAKPGPKPPARPAAKPTQKGSSQ